MVAWVLNFDAEDELAANGRPYTPNHAMRDRIARLESRVGALLAPGDVIVHDGTRVEGRPGDAWCPTPRARKLLARAGAIPPRAPPHQVLRDVNDRAFSARLGQTLPGAAYVTTADAVRATMEALPDVELWLLKRPLGFAGRGRRKINPRRTTVADSKWIEASLRDHGGLQVEQFVTRIADFALHGFVFENGAIRIGSPTLQTCDSHGAWQATTVAPPGALSSREERALVCEGERAAAALISMGYFGPFGIDAYRWEARENGARFNPRSEINARYSMGWAIGMGGWHPDR